MTRKMRFGMRMLGLLTVFVIVGVFVFNGVRVNVAVNAKMELPADFETYTTTGLNAVTITNTGYYYIQAWGGNGGNGGRGDANGIPGVGGTSSEVRGLYFLRAGDILTMHIGSAGGDGGAGGAANGARGTGGTNGTSPAVGSGGAGGTGGVSTSHTGGGGGGGGASTLVRIGSASAQIVLASGGGGGGGGASISNVVLARTGGKGGNSGTPTTAGTIASGVHGNNAGTSNTTGGGGSVTFSTNTIGIGLGGDIQNGKDNNSSSSGGAGGGGGGGYTIGGGEGIGGFKQTGQGNDNASAAASGGGGGGGNSYFSGTTTVAGLSTSKLASEAKPRPHATNGGVVITYYGIPSNITLHKNGGLSNVGTPVINGVWFGDLIPNIDLPSRPGYAFLGYYDTSASIGGTQYIKADGTSDVIWDQLPNTTTAEVINEELWARWDPYMYEIVFNAPNSTLPMQVVTDAIYDMPILGHMAISIPSKGVGYTFKGWSTSPTMGDEVDITSGTLYGTVAGSDDVMSINVYAQWSIADPTIVEPTSGLLFQKEFDGLPGVYTSKWEMRQVSITSENTTTGFGIYFVYQWQHGITSSGPFTNVGTPTTTTPANTQPQLADFLTDVVNVEQSGYYRLAVTAYDKDGIKSNTVYSQTAQVTITQKGMLGTTILVVDSITLDPSPIFYDGDPHMPMLIIEDDLGNLLIQDIDYSVSPALAPRTAIGIDTYTVNFKGNYAGGPYNVTFEVKERSPRITYNTGGKSTTNPSAFDTEEFVYPILPVLTPIAGSGYTFSGWLYGGFSGTLVDDEGDVASRNDHTLYANWILEKPTITPLNPNYDDIYDITKTYRLDNTLSTFTLSHSLTTNVLYGYSWEVSYNNGLTYTSCSTPGILRNVNDTGWYRLRVDMTHNDPTIGSKYSFNEFVFKVNITPKMLDDTNVYISPNKTLEFNGLARTITFEIWDGGYGTGYKLQEWEYEIENIGQEVKYVGTYNYIISMAESGNYDIDPNSYTVTITNPASANITFGNLKEAIVQVSPLAPDATGKYTNLPQPSSMTNSLTNIRSGYLFEGWSTSGISTDIVINGDMVEIAGNHVLYAVWSFDTSAFEDGTVYICDQFIDGVKNTDMPKTYQELVTYYKYNTNVRMSLEVITEFDLPSSLFQFTWSYAPLSDTFDPDDDYTLFSNEKDFYDIMYVTASGWYKVLVEMVEENVGTIPQTYYFRIEIAPQEITASNIVMDEFDWFTGLELYPSISIVDETGHTLEYGKDYSIVGIIAPAMPSFTAIGEYVIEFEFYDNYCDNGMPVQVKYYVRNPSMINLGGDLKGNSVTNPYYPTNDNKYPFGSLVGEIPTFPDDKGYKFLGWSLFSDNNGPSNLLEEASVCLLTNHTIFAVWDYDEEAIDFPTIGALLGEVSVSGAGANSSLLTIDREYKLGTNSFIIFNKNLSNLSDSIFEYEFFKYDSILGDYVSVYKGPNSFYTITNVWDSGDYKVKVYFTEINLGTNEREFTDVVSVDITPQVLYDSNIIVPKQSLTGSSVEASVTILDMDGNLIPATLNYSFIANGNAPINATGFFDVVVTFLPNRNYVFWDYDLNDGTTSLSCKVQMEVSADLIITFISYKTVLIEGADSIDYPNVYYHEITGAVSGDPYDYMPIVKNIPDGFIFAGWSLDGKGESLSVGDIITPFEATTLIAIWKADTVGIIDDPFPGAGLGHVELSGPGSALLSATRTYQLGSTNTMTFVLNPSLPYTTVTYWYQFQKYNDSLDVWEDVGVKSINNTYTFTNVSDSGLYQVIIELYDDVVGYLVHRAAYEGEVEIDINPQTVTWQANSPITADGIDKYFNEFIFVRNAFGVLLDFGVHFDLISTEGTYVTDPGVYPVTIQLLDDNYTFSGGFDFVDMNFVLSSNFVIRFDNLKTATLSIAPSVSVNPFGTNYPTLPTLNNIPSGYEFKGWSYNGDPVTDNGTLAVEGNHTLSAIWEFTYVEGTTIFGVKNADIDREYQYGIVDSLDFELMFAPVNADKIYVWQYSSDGINYGALPFGLNPVYTGMNTIVTIPGITNFAHSGYYKLTVLVKEDGIDLEVTKEYIWEVIIEQQLLDETNIDEVFHVFYDNTAKVPTIKVIDNYGSVVSDTEYIISYVATLVNANIYTIDVEFTGNYTGTAQFNFEIINDIWIDFAFTRGDNGWVAVQPTNDGHYQNLYIPTAIGYDFEGWMFNGEFYANTDELALYASHTLTAVWTLAKPTISVDPTLELINEEYAFGKSYNLTATANTLVSTSKAYAWYLVTSEGDEYLGNMMIYPVSKVSDTGIYKLVITCSDIGSNTSYEEQLFDVTITQKPIFDTDISIANRDFTRGFLEPNIVIMDGVYRLQYGIDYEVEGYDSFPSFRNMGTHTFYLNFFGNYSGDLVEANFTINIIKITYSDPAGVDVEIDATPDGKYPLIADPIRDGYVFNGWYFMSQRVFPDVTNLIFLVDHSVVAGWLIQSPTGETYVNGDETDHLYTNTTLVQGEYEIGKVYDLFVDMSHEAENDLTITYTYSWRYSRTRDGAYTPLSESTNTLAGLNSVSQSGWYLVIVTASDGTTSSAMVLFYFHIEISAKSITSDDITINDADYTRNPNIVNSNIVIYDGDYRLVHGIDYVINYGDSGTVTNMGTYNIIFSNAVNGNYSFTDIVLPFTIKPIYITYIDPKNNEVVRLATSDGKYPTVADPLMPGYEFNGWFIGLIEITENLLYLYDHPVVASWTLKAPTVISDSGNIKKDYDGITEVMSIGLEHILDNTNRINYFYEWSYSVNDTVYLPISLSNVYGVTNVRESGYYILSVYIKDSDGMNSEVIVHKFEVVIDPVVITDIIIKPQNWDGSYWIPSILIVHGDYRLVDGIDFYTYPAYGQNYEGSTFVGFSDMGMYEIYFYFPYMGNYTGDEDLMVIFEIIQIEISFNNPKGVAIPNRNTTVDGKYNLPVEPVLVGYTFVGWEYNGTIFKDNRTIIVNQNHTLNAIWTLNAPTKGTQASNVNKTYNQIANELSGNTTHILTGTTGFSLVYEWSYSATKTGTYLPISSNEKYSVINANQTGFYILTVYAKDSTNMVSTSITYEFEVNIEKVEIKESEIKILPQNWDGTKWLPVIIIMDGEYRLIEGIDYNINPAYGSIVGGSVYTGFSDMGKYDIEFSFPTNGNYYGVLPMKSIFEIYQIVITYKNGTEEFDKNSSVDGKYDLPTNPTRAGYVFEGWEYGVNIVKTNVNLIVNQNHTLTAKWVLETPSLVDPTNVEIKKIFDRLTNYLGATISHPAIGVAGVEIVYTWSYSVLENGPFSIISESSVYTAYGVYDVVQSGYYLLSAYVKDTNGLSSEVVSQKYSVEIDAKIIEGINIPSATYTGGPQTPSITMEHGSYTLVYGIDYYTSPSQGTEYTSMGYHDILFVFMGNYLGEGGEIMITKVFEITPIMISFIQTKGLVIPSIYVTLDGRYPKLPDNNDIVQIPGYILSGWTYDGVEVKAGEVLRTNINHPLEAIWKTGMSNIPEYDPDDITDPYHPLNPDNPLTGGSGHWEFKLTEKVADVNRTYEVGLYDTLYAKVTHILEDKISYTYQWFYSTSRNGSYRMLDGQTNLELSTTNVNETGWYQLVIAGKDDEGISTPTLYFIFQVTINPKVLNPGDISIPNQVYTGGGLVPNQVVMDQEYMLVYGVDYTMNPVDEYKEVGIYNIDFIFQGNYAGTITMQFEIEPNDTVINLWWLWLVGATALAIMAAAFYAIWLYQKNKRKKYGMKRRVSSFLDDFGKNS